MRTIVTVGVSPAWDVVCRGDDIEWGQHCNVTQNRNVAGKAFNLSRCLAWMGVKSIAAGLWGDGDFQEMLEGVKPLSEFVDVRFARAAGVTRENITVVDRKGAREIHLQSQSTLASSESLRSLKDSLGSIVNSRSICVFSGSMPAGSLEADIVDIAEMLKSSAGEVVVDSRGESLKYLVELGGLSVIKPNLSELCDLLGEEIEDTSGAIVEAASGLLDKSQTIVVSRGAKGAVVVTKGEAWKAGSKSCGKVVSTVGCGDYLLAGFISGGDIENGLIRGIKAATARAWAWPDRLGWDEAQEKIEVDICRLPGKL